MPITDAKFSPDGKKKKLVWDDNGTKKIVDTSSQDLPPVTPSDNGKVLGVDSGKWKPVSAPSGLPSVSSADEGKVLTVSNAGAWVAQMPSGGNGSYVVTYSLDGQDVVCDKTASEIATAFASEVPMMFVFINQDGSMVMANNYYAEGDDTYGYYVKSNFFSTDTDGSDPTYVLVIALTIEHSSGVSGDEITMTPVFGTIAVTTPQE